MNDAAESVDRNFHPQKRTWKQIWKKYGVYYLMLAPAIIFFCIFAYWPMTGLILAFRNFSFSSGMYGSGWVGLKYFRDFFSDPQAWNYIKNTLIISALKLFVYLPFPIILALVLNEIKSKPFRSTYQSISYLPYFISWVVVIGIMSRVFAPDTGLFNILLKKLGIGDGSMFWMMENKFFYPAIFISYLWKNIGWDSIIYFSTLVGIQPSLYEAAAIDGANRWKQTVHVSLPGLTNTIMVLFILSLGGILNAGFDQVYLMQNPGNYMVSETIDTYVVKTGLQQAQYGPATAIGLLQGIAGLLLTIIVNHLADKYSDNALW